MESQKFDPENTQKMLLGGTQRGKSSNSLGRTMTTADVDEDREIMQISDELDAMGQENIYMALGGNLGEQWEEISFNTLEFCNNMAANSIPFMFYRICKYYDFYSKFNFTHETCYNLCQELHKGYPKDNANAYHNYEHIVDSLQAMHYFMSVCNL